MGTLIPFLAVIGLFLVYLEFFIPSGFLAIIAACLFILSIVLLGLNTTWSGWTIGFCFLILISIWMVVHLALKKVKKQVSLKNDQEGFQASQYDVSCIGKEGIAFSDLKPSGYVMIEDKQIQAFSETGYISKGSPVVVLGGRGANLIVKRKEL